MVASIMFHSWHVLSWAFQLSNWFDHFVFNFVASIFYIFLRWFFVNEESIASSAPAEADGREGSFLAVSSLGLFNLNASIMFHSWHALSWAFQLSNWSDH